MTLYTFCVLQWAWQGGKEGERWSLAKGVWGGAKVAAAAVTLTWPEIERMKANKITMYA